MLKFRRKCRLRVVLGNRKRSRGKPVGEGAMEEKYCRVRTESQRGKRWPVCEVHPEGRKMHMRNDFL